MNKDVQMNVRINSSLKNRGDMVWSKVGYSPSAVVRALWQFAADNENNPSYVARILKFQPEHTENRTPKTDVHPSHRIEQFFSNRLSDSETVFAELSYKELRDKFYNNLIEEN